jgi:hypothetical protein
VLFKTSLNTAVKKMVLKYQIGKIFPPVYYTTLMYKVVNETPLVNSLSGYRTCTNSLPSLSSAKLRAIIVDFLPAKAAPLKAFERFDATAE